VGLTPVGKFPIPQIGEDVTRRNPTGLSPGYGPDEADAGVCPEREMTLRRDTRAAVCALTAMLLLSTIAGPAEADTNQEGSDTAFAGNGVQYGVWQKSNKRVRLKVSPSSTMSSTRCMDAKLDWGTEGSGHYDARVVRSCQPGTPEETDPDADGFWVEPSDWGGRNIGGIQKGFGYIISDSTLAVLLDERFENTGSGDLEQFAPGTGTQGYARVRTRYNNGTVKSCNPLPVNSGDGSGGCS
jgi:hypothetical protein